MPEVMLVSNILFVMLGLILSVKSNRVRHRAIELIWSTRECQDMVIQLDRKELAKAIGGVPWQTKDSL